MATIVNRPISDNAGNSRALTLSPITLWASIGTVLLGINGYAMLRWITGPNFKPAPLGDAVIPAGELTALYVFQGLSIIAALLFFWFSLIKPWRRNGSVSWDGLMVIAFFTMWVWDPLTNAINHTWWYNGYLFNMSSWANFLPGWSSPNGGNFVEPIFLMGPCYIWFFLGPTIFGCFVLRQLRNKYPDMGTAKSFAILFGGMAIFDAVVEIYFCQTGAGAYPGVVQSLSLWPATPKQWPLYEGAIMGMTLSALVGLRYFRDDKGHSFCERGVDKLAISSRAKTFVRFLALVGASHSIYLIVYFLPWNLFAMKIDTHTPMPSYMRHEVCGKGTAYVCPSEYVPMQTRTSIPIGPDDPRLPEIVRNSQDGPPYSMFAH